MPDCKEKLAYNVPFTIVILNLLHMASHNSLGNNSERCGYWFCKGDSFWMKLCKVDSKLTFNSLKEIDVAFVKQQIYEAILIDEKIVKARRRKIQ
jgi:hypothetical protein